MFALFIEISSPIYKIRLNNNEIKKESRATLEISAILILNDKNLTGAVYY
jgi:hypothetical protein